MGFKLISASSYNILISVIQGSHLELTFGCDLYNSQSRKVGGEKDHGKTGLNNRPLLLHHLCVIVHFEATVFIFGMQIAEPSLTTTTYFIFLNSA